MTRLLAVLVLVCGAVAGCRRKAVPITVDPTPAPDAAARTAGWAKSGALAKPEPDESQAFTLGAGRVLLWKATPEVYDVATGTWHAIAERPACSHVEPFGFERVVRVPSEDGGNIVFPVGAKCGYEPNHDRWSNVPEFDLTNLTGATAGWSATELTKGDVLVAGGGVWFGALGGHTYARRDVLRYDATTKKIAKLAPLASRRMHHDAVRLSDALVLVVGGEAAEDAMDAGPPSEDDPPPMELFDPKKNAFRVVGPQTYEGTPVALTDGRVLFLQATTCALFDVAISAWKKCAPMMTPRSGFSTTLLDDGRLLIAGGRAEPSTPPKLLAVAELYDPKIDAWLPLPPMPMARGDHAAVRLDDGRVLLAGGRAEVGEASTSVLFVPAVR